jgi:hypothetical protein
LKVTGGAVYFTESEAFYPNIHIRYIITQCRQNVEYFDVKLGGMYINQWAVSVN